MSTTRTARLKVPPPRDVGHRCELSTHVVLDVMNALRGDEPPARAELLALAEKLRGVFVDLALAAGWLNGAEPDEREAAVPCPECHGSRRSVNAEFCSSCEGTGRIQPDLDQRITEAERRLTEGLDSGAVSQ